MHGAIEYAPLEHSVLIDCNPTFRGITFRICIALDYDFWAFYVGDSLYAVDGESTLI